MAAKRAKNGNPDWLSTARIQALADCVFAFAMTLLVLNLIFPNPTNNLNEVELTDFLGSQIKGFYNFIISFLILALFWVTNTQQFHYFKGTNTTHLWINIITLLFIVLIPFSTSLMSDYPDDPVADMFFAINLFIVGALYYINWEYATSNYRFIKKSISREEIARAKRETLVIPAVAICSLLFAFISPFLAEYSYILIPIVRVIMVGKRSE